jgi:hypothetical protein
MFGDLVPGADAAEMKKTALVKEPDTLKIWTLVFSGGPIIGPEVEELREDGVEKLLDRDQVGTCNFCST